MTAQPQVAVSLASGQPPEYPVGLMPEIRDAIRTSGKTLVVLDDDPTGTQTVHDVSVLTVWDVESLAAMLGSGATCFYILTNSRSLPAADAERLNREIGTNLRIASERTGRALAVTSRSDSTLRGHFPGEVRALESALGAEFDAWLLVPFFLEGGRFTVDDVHYVAEGSCFIPAAETPYARDAAFGYQNSNLRAWVEEKTGGQVRADEVVSISLETIRRGPEQVCEQLMAMPRGSIGVVNALTYRDMESFVAGLLRAEAAGKRYLYRTAASFVRVRAGIEARPLLSAHDLALPAKGGGLFVVGSYVPKTTAQLEMLLTHTDIAAIEIQASLLVDETSAEGEIQRVAATVNRLLEAGRDVVVYTSRALVRGSDPAHSLHLGSRVSQGLIDVVRRLTVQPRYLVAKGGITSSDVATQGLGVQRATVAGQILPGVPVWVLGEESRFPGAAYVVFPGNVGNENSLALVFKALRLA